LMPDPACPAKSYHGCHDHLTVPAERNLADHDLPSLPHPTLPYSTRLESPGLACLATNAKT
jgi:hypothetical protein